MPTRMVALSRPAAAPAAGPRLRAHPAPSLAGRRQLAVMARGGAPGLAQAVADDAKSGTLPNLIPKLSRVFDCNRFWQWFPSQPSAPDLIGRLGSGTKPAAGRFVDFAAPTVQTVAGTCQREQDATTGSRSAPVFRGGSMRLGLKWTAARSARLAAHAHVTGAGSFDEDGCSVRHIDAGEADHACFAISPSGRRQPFAVSTGAYMNKLVLLSSSTTIWLGSFPRLHLTQSVLISGGPIQ